MRDLQVKMKDGSMQKQLISQNQGDCKNPVSCALRVALDVLPSGIIKFGVSLLHKLPAILKFFG